MGCTSCNEKQDLLIRKGSSKTYLLTVTDDAGDRVDLTGATVYFTVKDETLATSEIVKTSAVITEVEILSQVTEATKGQANIFIQPSDTSSLTEGVHVYDAWVQLSSGVRYPVVPPSQFFIQSSVTTTF